MKSRFSAVLSAIFLAACVGAPVKEQDQYMKKTFAPFPGGELRELAPNRGACFATDMITVEGKRVRFMYREKPDRPVDSGWRFMAGYESDVYMDNPKNHGVYDVNTIANFDPDIIPLLDSPIGTAFERPDGKDFVAVEFTPPE